MGQFKGLTQGTQQDKYVRVVCRGVAPMFADTYPTALDAGTDNGWMLTCYTGISQCRHTSNGAGNAAPTILDNVTATESTDCMNDPRYLTWRVMTMRLKIDGTQSWYRTDQYWNSAKTQFSSTWGTGLVLSTHDFLSVNDNTGTTGAATLGKTFVFAYGDGSGIQFNHISFGSTAPTGNTTAGSGTNALTAAPGAYTNTSPNMVNENYCAGTDLMLAGTADTSSLSSTITDFSDGYLGTITIALEMFQAGAASGWRGVCLVYYSSQYVQSNSNGSLCFAAQQSSTVGKGPLDFGAGYLMHVPSASWQPPTMSASVTPSGSALSGGKYSIVYTPSAETSYIFTSNYYASVTWYQPSYASSYADIARYGKDDYLGAYCMQGAGSTSYFSAPAAALKLTGAAYLAVGLLSVGTALSLAM